MPSSHDDLPCGRAGQSTHAGPSGGLAHGGMLQSGGSSSSFGHLEQEPKKLCVLCAIFHVIRDRFAEGFVRFVYWIDASQPHRAPFQQFTAEPKRRDCDHDGKTDDQCLGLEQGPMSRQITPSSTWDGPENIQIKVPIVKPPGWNDLAPFVHHLPVTFDERGLKEVMTVRADQWPRFVDRQRAKLEQEIRDARAMLYSGFEDIREEDISELDQLVSRMEDWKDLSRYVGKSISMGSTQRGNEMKLHIMAFTVRDDGTGVDFLRISYKKSIEVRENAHPIITGPGPWAQLLASILPQVEASEEQQQSHEDRWIQLLQRPDVAKFAIALAFRGALESDGVYLQICDAKIDDCLSPRS